MYSNRQERIAALMLNWTSHPDATGRPFILPDEHGNVEIIFPLGSDDSGTVTIKLYATGHDFYDPDFSYDNADGQSLSHGITEIIAAEQYFKQYLADKYPLAGDELDF
jgi:hypothetical protein